MAQEFQNDVSKVANNFDEFIAQWSGLYTMAENKGISKESLTNNTERNIAQKVWILEHFAGETPNSWRTEVHMKENTNGSYHNTRYNNDSYINQHYQRLLEHYESAFAIQTVYKDIFTDVNYNEDLNMFIVDDSTSMHQKVKDYINDSSIELEKRLYLTSIMQMQGIYLGYDKNEIISSITDTYVQDLVSDIFDGEVNLQVYTDETTFFENDALVIGSKEDDLIQTTKNFSYQNSKATIIGGRGDDRIITVSGETTYIYNSGDGVELLDLRISVN